MPLNSTRGAGSAKAFGFTVAAGGLLVDYMLIAGGGGGGNDCGGGGGAGGYRASFPGGTKFTLAIGTNPITIGAGGAAGSNSYPFSGADLSSSGIDSTLSNGTTTITAAGGGFGGNGAILGVPTANQGATGGSGGGDSSTIAPTSATRAGNTPPVSPSQGNPSSVSLSSPFNRGGGGGGSSAAGSGGNGGNGTDTTPVFGTSPQPFYGPTSGVYGGGAGGGAGGPPAATGGTGGTGGGGTGHNYGQGPFPGAQGVTNSGGGGGGYGQRAIPGRQYGGAGGSGRASIFVPASIAPRVSVSPVTNTKTAVPTGSVLNFTVNGNITVT